MSADAASVAAGIRTDAFNAKYGVAPSVLGYAASVIAEGLKKRLAEILKSKPWYWRLLFGYGLKFCIEVLEQLAAQIKGDYPPEAS